MERGLASDGWSGRPSYYLKHKHKHKRNLFRVMTICEPASHASHANFAFKSKHPYQIALINCY